jgi:hypothetical protein
MPIATFSNLYKFESREKLVMGKFFAWFFATAGLYAFCTSGFGLLLFGIAIMGFFGKIIGESFLLTTIYILLAMSASYIFPIVIAVYKQQLKWLLIIPMMTSFLFAVPSSFVWLAGCESGNESSTWAMRAIPIMWLGELTIAPPGQELACTYSQEQLNG